MSERTADAIRIALFTNPASGAGRGREIADRAIGRLRARGANVTEYIGSDADDARRLAREVIDAGTDVVVVVGGDGMVSHALQQLAGTDIPLGLIPAGTGNDHARAFGIPRDDPEAAADVVLDGESRRIDLGRITAADGTVRWFGSIAAAGFDSLVTDRTNRLSWPKGRARYHVALAAELVNLRPLPLRMVLDDDRVIEQDMTLVAIGNTSSYGGGMRICPGADPTDGLFDITVLGAVGLPRLALTFPRLFGGTHVGRPEVQTFRSATVRLESPGINGYADGEFVAPLPIEIQVVPRQLSIRVSRVAA